MSAEIEKATWNKLCEKLAPSTKASGEIEKVVVKLRNGGIVATTCEPRPSIEDVSFDESQEPPFESNSGEESEIEQNEEVFIYEDFGIEIKTLIDDCLESAIRDTPVNCSVEFRRAILDDEYIRPVFRVNVGLSSNKTNLYTELADALVANERIDSRQEFAYGSIDKCWYNDGERGFTEGWEFDGTLYRYTQEPYRWWSEGPDTDEPSDMDAWAEFASETESEREQVRNRDRHVVHFHPMERGLSKDNSYVQWFNKAEDILYDKIELSGSEESFRLNSVRLDESGVNLEGSLTA